MNDFLSKLTVPYFEKTNKKILNKYLSKYGFEFLNCSKTEIVYNRNDIFISLSYWPEDAPNYSLIIATGFMDKKLNQYEGVGLWYVLPSKGKEFGYHTWQFRTQEELEERLIFICEEIIEKYVKDLWKNPDKLRFHIDSQFAEIKLENERHAREQSIIQAKNAFDSGQLKKAIKIYEEIGIKNLTAAELRIYKVCLKTVNKS